MIVRYCRCHEPMVRKGAIYVCAKHRCGTIRWAAPIPPKPEPLFR